MKTSREVIFVTGSQLVPNWFPEPVRLTVELVPGAYYPPSGGDSRGTSSRGEDGKVLWILKPELVPEEVRGCGRVVEGPSARSWRPRLGWGVPAGVVEQVPGMQSRGIARIGFRPVRLAGGGEHRFGGPARRITGYREWIAHIRPDSATGEIKHGMAARRQAFGAHRQAPTAPGPCGASVRARAARRAAVAPMAAASDRPAVLTIEGGVR